MKDTQQPILLAISALELTMLNYFKHRKPEMADIEKTHPELFKAGLEAFQASEPAMMRLMLSSYYLKSSMGWLI